MEGISTGPLAEILNYTTGITFEGFAASERMFAAIAQSSVHRLGDELEGAKWVIPVSILANYTPR